MALAALSLLLFLTAAFALTTRAPSADASDSETMALIGLINGGRSSSLSVSAAANADAQAAAQNAVNACGYNYGLNGHNAMLVSYGFTTAQAIYSAWAADSYYSSVMNNSNYHSVGIGRAKNQGCSLGYLWVAYFDRAGGGETTTPTTHTPSPTPSGTPTPTLSSTTSTPTPTPTSAPTPSPTPTAPCARISGVSVQCTPTPTAVPTDSPTPTVSPVVTPSMDLPGDADCNETVNEQDGMIVLLWAAGFTPISPCLNQNDGVNCLEGIDVSDVLAIISYLGSIPFSLPAGCPAIGILLTPSASPVPTSSPTPTATPVVTGTPIPTETPPVSPTATSASGDDIDQCQLALVSYQLDTNLLDGELACTPSAGTSYNCNFGNGTASCAATTAAYPDYTCSFTTGYAGCIPNSGVPEYQCFLNAPGAVECLPTYVGYPTYDCAISGGTVTCISAPPFPDFVCTKQEIDFDCVAQ